MSSMRAADPARACECRVGSRQVRHAPVPSGESEPERGCPLRAECRQDPGVARGGLRARVGQDEADDCRCRAWVHDRSCALRRHAGESGRGHAAAVPPAAAVGGACGPGIDQTPSAHIRAVTQPVLLSWTPDASGRQGSGRASCGPTRRTGGLTGRARRVARIIPCRSAMPARAAGPLAGARHRPGPAGDFDEHQCRPYGQMGGVSRRLPGTRDEQPCGRRTTRRRSPKA